MFVSTDDGEIPLSKITCAVVRRESVTIIYGNDAETRTTPAVWETTLRDTPVQMITAESGTYLLHADLIDGDFWVGRSKVLAWSMSADGILYPLTTEGMNGGEHDALPVLHPDGTVDVFGDRTYDSFETWSAATESTLRSKSSGQKAA